MVSAVDEEEVSGAADSSTADSTAPPIQQATPQGTSHGVKVSVSDEGTYALVVSPNAARAATIASGMLERLNAVGPSLCEPIRVACGSRDHVGASDALTKALTAGLMTVFAPPLWLLDELMMVDAGALEPAHAKQLHGVRADLAMAARRYADAEADIRALLEGERWTLEAGARAGFTLAAADALSGLDKKELAFLRYRRVLEMDDLEPRTRALAHHGVARALGGDAEAISHERLASDAFLQAGDRIKAARCLVAVAHRLRYPDTKAALAALREATRLVEIESSPVGKAVLADVHRKHASILVLVGELDAAAEMNDRAIALERELVGANAEAHLGASLAQGVDIAERSGNEEKRAALDKELDALQARRADPASSLRDRLRTCGEVAADEAATLLAELKAVGDPDLIVTFHVMRALHMAAMDIDGSIEHLEEAWSTLKSIEPADSGREEAVVEAYACCYEEAKRDEDAYKWHRRVLALNPFNFRSRQNSAAFLQRSKRWKELAELAEADRARFGDLPGILTTLGQAWLELGRKNEALAILILARQKRDSPSRFNDELIARAAAAGAELPAGGAEAPPPKRVVTRADFEGALADLALHVSHAQRMTFWQAATTSKRRGKGDGHVWVSKPERHATIVLRAFLASRFGLAIEDFQELATGAGRIDLLVIATGGLRLIIELKMCGDPYTQAYASDGIDQLRHYMGTKRTALGYLLVFDGRRRDFGKGLAETIPCDEGTIFVRFVDLRPVIEKAGG